MAREKNNKLTFVVPSLGRKEALDMKEELILNTKRIAPGARGSICIGKRKNYETIVKRCERELRAR